MFAVQGENIDLIRFLLEEGSNVDMMGKVSQNLPISRRCTIKCRETRGACDAPELECGILCTAAAFAKLTLYPHVFSMV